MNIQDVYSRLVEKIGTPDDTSGRAANPQCTNTVLLNELLDQLRSYANITKGIQDIYSYSLNTGISFIPAPTLALRSQSYLNGYVIINCAKFPLDFRNPKEVTPNFRISPIYGIPNWIMPYNEGKTPYLGIFPMAGTDAKSVLLTDDISAVDTTIPVVSTTGFVHNFGRLTIGTEVIFYQSTDSTNFYGCVRGTEMSTVAIHLTGVTAYQNNLVLQYCRLPVSFAAENDGSISAGTLAHMLEPCDEHMEGIIKATVYNRLNKIDPSRAEAYKIDTLVLYQQYEKDIAKGYAKNRQNVDVRNPYAINEQGIPYGTNLLW